MITMIGALIGFFSSFMPMLFDFLTSRSNAKRDLELARISAENSAAALNLEQIRAAYAQEATQSAPGWVDAIRALVRPSITYLFVLLFVGVKFVGMYRLNQIGVPYIDSIQVFWDEQTSGLFALIIAFWFGNRSVEKRR